ncbi:alpha/beta-hydrolase [Pluteus cervinus]|uniref:Alpha/beta-hydrolase n=1 Tax=Pluteus cervinus TaxID=181527 RepID=A0ACD3B5Y3_9AGAR|nr:alpha/beta-hydrolase [Pluteus cervinus]
MPTATTDKEGSYFYFVDTGAVPGSNNYTTLVMYHGACFNSETFKKLLPLAPASNIRLVTVNRRNYPGSSPFTPADITNLATKAGLDQMATDVAGFLTWFVDHNDIPRASADGKSGGLAVLGWSMGSCSLVAFLGQPDVVGAQTYTKLEPYLRKAIIYDSPSLGLGFESPPHLRLMPFIDPTKGNTPEAVDVQGFADWVGSHYSHPGDIDTNDISALDTVSKGTRPHTSVLSDAERKTIIQFDKLGFEMALTPVLHLIREQTDKALLDETYAKSVLPKLTVVHFVCLSTGWMPLYGLQQVRKAREELIAKGKVLRPYEVVKLPGEDHFAHWEAPEKFFSKLVEAL